MISCLVIDLMDPVIVAVSAVWLGLVFLTVWVWGQHDFPGKATFLITHLAMLWWLLAALLELGSSGVECKVFWAQAAWPGIVLMVTAWTLFLFDYALGQERKFKRWRHAILFAGPAVIAGSAISNGWHHAFYGPQTRLVDLSGRMSVVYDHGPLFYGAIVYNYLLIMAPVIIASLAARRALPGVRGFFGMLLLITLVPIAGNLAYVIGGFTIAGFDPTPFTFTFVLAAFSWMLANNRMMDIHAIARDLLFYNTKNPIIIMDSDGSVAGYNPAARGVFDLHLPLPFTVSARLKGIGPVVTQLFTTGHLVQNEPMMWNGRWFAPQAKVIYSPLSPSRISMGWVVTFVDVSTQQRDAAALRQAAEQARAADRAKSQFLSTVSHELRTPLTSIKGSLDLLDAGVVGEVPQEMKRLLTIARSNSNRLAALIDDLLDLQKIETGELTVDLVAVDMAQLVQDSVEACEGFASSMNVTIVTTGTEQPLYVKGDHGRLMQVLGNVLSNAFKFSNSGGSVAVSLQSHDAGLCLSVRDNGIGMPDNVEDKVFGPFSQVDASDTRKKGGSGLGLNITRRILEKHHGTIDYVSELGVGTTFFITLPTISPDAL
ncbi:histidine kinase N-terminal 7TM domain-containing protein [Pseudogemmobacter sp. W21_MBD1_M6]|uniref:histidine kinase N-terminal 7TM domain-containing protein n=1 Tax=Pseudogemmobacter sp. W21_MBD1_M6 TaxID=3240271 RepID=UPI003F9C2C63